MTWRNARDKAMRMRPLPGMAQAMPLLALSCALMGPLASSAALAQQPAAGAVRFTSADALLAGPSLEGGMHSCQPLRGDLATITGAGVKVFGTEMLPVTVGGGSRCDGVSGSRVRHFPAVFAGALQCRQPLSGAFCVFL